MSVCFSVCTQTLEADTHGWNPRAASIATKISNMKIQMNKIAMRPNIARPVITETLE